jgi:predicted nucleotidyltransferase
MDPNDHEILRRLKQSIEGRVRLSEMILFGSRSRGDAEPDSIGR